MAIKYFKVLHGAWRQVPDTAIYTDGKLDEKKLAEFTKQGYKVKKQDGEKLSDVKGVSTCKECATLEAEIVKLKEAKEDTKSADALKVATEKVATLEATIKDKDAEIKKLTDAK